MQVLNKTAQRPVGQRAQRAQNSRKMAVVRAATAAAEPKTLVTTKSDEVRKDGCGGVRWQCSMA